MSPSDTEADGVTQASDAFSKPREVHAFVHGIYKGLLHLDTGPQYSDSKQEPHYWRGGYVVGRVLSVVLMAVGALTAAGGV